MSTGHRFTPQVGRGSLLGDRTSMTFYTMVRHRSLTSLFFFWVRSGDRTSLILCTMVRSGGRTSFGVVRSLGGERFALVLSFGGRMLGFEVFVGAGEEVVAAEEAV